MKKKLGLAYMFITRVIPLGLFLIVTSPIWIVIWLFETVDEHLTEWSGWS